MNTLKHNFLLAKHTLKDLASNQIRSVLTILGIVVGISSVTIMVSVGESAKAMIEESITSRLGSNTLMVIPGSGDEGMLSMSTFAGELSNDDYDTIIDANIKHITGVSRRTMSTSQVSYIIQNQNATTVLIDRDYTKSITLDIQGRFFSNTDILLNKKVVLVHEELASKLSPNASLVGKTIYIDGKAFSVIGIVSSNNGTSSTISPLQNAIYIPYDVYYKTVNSSVQPQTIFIAVDSQENIEIVKNTITQLLRKRHNLSLDQTADFTVQAQEDILDTMNTITGIVTTFITVIAGISLVVGGIGVMNIMLVSVKERLKEIGLRKALGATNKDVFVQIMTESIIFSVMGGIIGIILGNLGSYAIESIATLPFVISPIAIISSLAISTAVGAIFGLYPAKQAAALSPIEAIRSE